jgi:protein-S-isoprenylcysteine O-methyltransferase Ste14
VLATYTASMFVGFHLRIIHGEEPRLARTHGTQWQENRARVPRWRF